MTYNQYYNCRKTINEQMLPLMYKQMRTLENCYQVTQMQSVKVEAAHLQEVIGRLEEAVNLLEYFTNGG